MKTTASEKVIQINNLPNALIASFLNIAVNDVVAEKKINLPECNGQIELKIR